MIIQLPPVGLFVVPFWHDPLMITLRRERPGDRILRCHAKRSPRGVVHCEKEALHTEGSVGYGDKEHAGRDKWGRWHFWF